MVCYYTDKTEEDVKCDICRELAEKEVTFHTGIYYCCSDEVCFKRLKMKIARATIKKRGQ